ncbi:MAG: peptidylprolyl isomerase [Bacteroidota bacterium]
MALIGKIREKSALMVILIGVALLAFILGDWQKITGGMEDVLGYGTVSGESIDAKAFEEAKINFESQDRNQFAQQGREFTQKDQDASEEKAFNYVVETSIFNKEYDALGIDVSDAELDAYLYGTEGFSVLPDLASGFTDSTTGLFNAKLLQKKIEEMEKSTDKNVQKQWQDTKKYYVDRRKQEKYFTIVQQGLYATKLEAEDDYIAKNEKKNISFVVRRYSEIADDEIKISDEAVENYYNEHKNEKKYENRTASREVRWFDISISPSKRDSSEFNTKMNDLRSAFAAAVNDSMYVMQNSDLKFYSSTKVATAVPEGHPKAQNVAVTYPRMMDSTFAKAKIGDIVGPFNGKDGNLVLSKVIGFTPQSLTARHILISTKGATDDAAFAKAQKKADSIMKFLTKENFDENIMKFTDDRDQQGMPNSGGKYANFIEAEMVPEFSTFAATKAIGTIGAVKTQFGIHIMEVLERSGDRFPVVASIQKTFKPSQETIDEKDAEVYNLLYKLDQKIASKSSPIKKLAAFDTIVQRAGYFARPLTLQDEAPRLYGFNTPFAEDKILKLAFNEDAIVGDLIAAPIKDKDRYIIAVVSAIRKKGVPNYEDVELVMRKDLLQEKKVARLTNQLLKDKKLEDMAKRGNTMVSKAEVTFGTPQITGAGYEPEVIGALFSGLKDGQKTLPLKGSMGVYVVRIDNTVKAPTVANYKTEQQAMLDMLKGSAGQSVVAALKKKAEVIDNRRLLKTGVRR